MGGMDYKRVDCSMKSPCISACSTIVCSIPLLVYNICSYFAKYSESAFHFPSCHFRALFHSSLSSPQTSLMLLNKATIQKSANPGLSGDPDRNMTPGLYHLAIFPQDSSACFHAASRASGVLGCSSNRGAPTSTLRALMNQSCEYSFNILAVLGIISTPRYGPSTTMSWSENALYRP